MKENKSMTIKEMPVDVNAKLKSDVRKNLSDVIEREFKNRIDVDYNHKNEMRKSIIEKHKKRLNIEKLINEIKSKKEEYDNLVKKLDSLGFRNGEYSNGYNQEVEEELTSLNKTSQEILTVKHKLITRLQLSTTVGEATVIMHEILGNTLIPTLRLNSITFQNSNK